MAPYPFVVVAKIAGAIQPLDRGSRYEDPLSTVLTEHAAGQVNGAGTQLDEKFEIAFADIELTLQNLDDALKLVLRTLVNIGVPQGSVLYFLRDGRPRELPIVTDGVETDSTEATKALLRRLDRSVHRDQAGAAATAAKTLASYQRLWVVRPELRAVDVSQYDSLLVAWYESVTTELATLGFSALGDFSSEEDPAAAKPGLPPFARKFLSVDGRVRASAFKLAVTVRGRAHSGVVGFTSELDNGTFLTTSNLREVWNIPPQMLAERLAPETTPTHIATRHLERLEAWLQDHPGGRVLLLPSLEALAASELRGKSLTSEFRRSQGVPSAAELERMGAKPLLAAMVHEEMKRLLARSTG